MIRSATAHWYGGPGAGEGSVTTSSGVITDALYSFSSGSGTEPCTSPGEMLAAAEASCMSLMFAQAIAKAGFKPNEIKTTSQLTIEEVNSVWTITRIDLDVVVDSPQMDPDTFRMIAEMAKARCPITRLLNAEIVMNARLLSAEIPMVA